MSTPVLLALLWGFAEATFFFFVPDVLLTFLALRGLGLGPAIEGTLASLVGALSGGLIVYALGAAAPKRTRLALGLVPGIGRPLIDSVRADLNRRGLRALFLGPTKGVPYKIYAAEWGARRGNMMQFALVSIPARYLRFLFSALVAYGFRRLVSARTADFVLAAFWIVFYIFYFRRFGRWLQRSAAGAGGA